MLHAKTFQVLHFEVAQELLSRGLFRERPIIEFKGDIACTETSLEHHSFATLVENFLRSKRCHELVDVVRRTFCHEKLARAYVQKRHSASLLTEVYCAKEVVFLVVEHRICHCDTRRDQFRNASLDKCLRQFRVFKLVAYCNPLASPDKFRQVSIEGMIGETSHRSTLRDACLAIVSMGERDAKYLGGNHRIVGIRLVEVAATEQEQRLGVLRLEVVELFHHWSQRFLCHNP